MEGPSPRIVKETKTIQSDPVPGIAFTPDSNNYKHFYIELQGMDGSIQAHLALATKAADSGQSCSCPMITRCLHPRSFLIPRSTTPTSVHFQSYRQPRQNLPRYSQEELVASTANEVSPPFHPEPARRAQPRWPSQQRGRSWVEVQQEGRRIKGKAVHPPIR